MLALAFLLKKDELWARAETVVWRLVKTKEEWCPPRRSSMRYWAADAFLLEWTSLCHDGDPFDFVLKYSAEADFLFLGLRPREAGETLADYAHYYVNLVRQTEGVPRTVTVIAGGEVNLHRLFAAV